MKAKDVLKDDVCLANVVKELIELNEEFDDDGRPGKRDVFVECSCWICDHIEKCALMGTITHSGLLTH